jgi:hypothetical protein
VRSLRNFAVAPAGALWGFGDGVPTAVAVGYSLASLPGLRACSGSRFLQCIGDMFDRVAIY